MENILKNLQQNLQDVQKIQNIQNFDPITVLVVAGTVIVFYAGYLNNNVISQSLILLLIIDQSSKSTANSSLGLEKRPLAIGRARLSRSYRKGSSTDPFAWLKRLNIYRLITDYIYFEEILNDPRMSLEGLFLLEELINEFKIIHDVLFYEEPDLQSYLDHTIFIIKENQNNKKI